MRGENMAAVSKVGWCEGVRDRIGMFTTDQH